MKRYLVVLGRKDDLALAELQTVLLRSRKLSDLSIFKLNHTIIIKIKNDLDPNSLIQILGGTVKIARLGRSVTAKNFIDRLVHVLRNESIGKAKLVFAVSLVGSRDSEQRFLIPKILKDRLAQENINARYILPKRSDELTSAQVLLHDLVELYVVWRDSVIEIGRTVSLQDFEGFASRDYQRPYANPKGGMLPPKVARQMVNLAFPKSIKPTMWVLDPFCGTGTIAMEATLLGLNTISSDHNRQQTLGTKRNLSWLTRQEKLGCRWQVLHSDATHISKQLKNNVDGIVTEPYLGPVKFTASKLSDIVKGLNKLYLGSMKDWHKILVPKGRVVIVLPEFAVGNIVKRADLVIDRCENLGYTLVAGPFEYDRPQAKVRRRIVVFQRV